MKCNIIKEKKKFRSKEHSLGFTSPDTYHHIMMDPDPAKRSGYAHNDPDTPMVRIRAYPDRKKLMLAYQIKYYFNLCYSVFWRIQIIIKKISKSRNFCFSKNAETFFQVLKKSVISRHFRRSLACLHIE